MQERSNQNPSIEKGQTTQWPKENGQTTIYKTLSRKLKIEQHKYIVHAYFGRERAKQHLKKNRNEGRMAIMGQLR
jgi:hypothetical protein